MLPDRVSIPGPLTYESGALPIALRGPANAFGNESFIFRWGGGQNFLVIYCGRIGGWVAGGQK